MLLTGVRESVSLQSSDRRPIVAGNLSGCRSSNDRDILKEAEDQFCTSTSDVSDYLRNQLEFEEIHKGIHWILTQEFKLKDLDIKWTPALESKGRTHITFEGKEFDLFFIVSDNKIHYLLPPKGTKLEELTSNSLHSVTCFKMIVDPKTGTSEIRYVFADPKCDLPTEKRGTFLLNLAEAINRTHFIRRSHLSDMSTVDCKKDNNFQAKLGFLKMLETGNTWYEGFAFSSDRIASSQVNQLKEMFRSQTLNTVLDALRSKEKSLLPHLTSCKEEIETIEKLVKTFHDKNKDNNSLRDFILWAWDNHCDQSTKIMRTLFQETMLDNDTKSKCGDNANLDERLFPWPKLYHIFKYSIQSMTKIYFPSCRTLSQ